MDTDTDTRIRIRIRNELRYQHATLHSTVQHSFSNGTNDTGPARTYDRIFYDLNVQSVITVMVLFSRSITCPIIPPPKIFFVFFTRSARKTHIQPDIRYTVDCTVPLWSAVYRLRWHYLKAIQEVKLRKKYRYLSTKMYFKFLRWLNSYRT